MISYVEHVQNLIVANKWDAHQHRYFRNGDITIYGHSEENPITKRDEYFVLRYHKGWFQATVSLSRHQYGVLMDECGKNDIHKYTIPLTTGEHKQFLKLLPMITLIIRERAEEHLKTEKAKVESKRVWP